MSATEALLMTDIDPAVLTVDPEFAGLIPPLNADELRELETSLVEHGGAREPLIAWDRGSTFPPILLDGHNRLAICRRLGLTYAVKGMAFDTRDEAKRWMDRNQLGRRNINPDGFVLLLGRLYNETKGLSAGCRSRKYVGRGYDNAAHELGAPHGISEKTVRRAGKFREAAEKLGVVEDIATGKLRVPSKTLISAAERMPAGSSREDVYAALNVRCGRANPLKRKLAKPKPGGAQWLSPANPDDCLKAIKFYAKTFLHRSPSSVDALTNLLLALIEENEAPKKESEAAA